MKDLESHKHGGLAHTLVKRRANEGMTLHVCIILGVRTHDHSSGAVVKHSDTTGGCVHVGCAGFQSRGSTVGWGCSIRGVVTHKRYQAKRGHECVDGHRLHNLKCIKMAETLHNY